MKGDIGQKHRVLRPDVALSVTCYPGPVEETVIMLHGGPGVPDDFTEVREWFNIRYRVLLFDQRETGNSRFAGKSNRCRHTMEDYIGDIRAIADAFQLSRFHLFGHSWGGLYAQVYAKSYPQDIISLFLCSPASGTGKAIWKQTEKEVSQYIRKRNSLFSLLYTVFLSVLASAGSDAACRNLFNRIIDTYHRGYGVPPIDRSKLSRIKARSVYKVRKAVKNWPPLGEFGSTPFPVLISYGSQDIYGSSRKYTLDRFPSCRSVIVDACGHTPWKHNWSAFRSILDGFYLQEKITEG